MWTYSYTCFLSIHFYQKKKIKRELKRILNLLKVQILIIIIIMKVYKYISKMLYHDDKVEQKKYIIKWND